MESGDDCCLNHSRAAASTRLHPINVTTPRLALLAFRRCYNETWILERHGYRTPAAIRTAQTRPAALAA